MPYPNLDFIGATDSDGFYNIFYYADNGKIVPYPDEGLPSDCEWMPPVPNKWDL